LKVFALVIRRWRGVGMRDAVAPPRIFELDWSFVPWMKSSTACFAGPLFQEAIEQRCVAGAYAGAEKRKVDKAGSGARPEISALWVMPDNELSDFILISSGCTLSFEQ
jgi:hypothetical protein